MFDASTSLHVPFLLAFIWPAWVTGLLIFLFIAVCVVMVLTVLIQKPQGGGLASAFGGGVSSGQTAFGTKTGDALTVFTIAVFVLYLLLAMVLNFAAAPQALSAPTAASRTTENSATPVDPLAPTNLDPNAVAPSGPNSGPNSPLEPTQVPVLPAATEPTTTGNPGAAPASPSATPEGMPGTMPAPVVPPATSPTALPTALPTSPPPSPGEAVVPVAPANPANPPK